MASPPKPRKLDIFEALDAIDRRRSGWLEKKPEDAQKEFAPPVVLRWASAVEGSGQMVDYHLRVVNERANVHAPVTMNHPDLFFRLLASTGLGQRQRHQWLSPPGRSKTSSKPRELVARLNPMASDAEIDLLLSLHTPETFVALVRGAGLTPQEEKEVLKAYGATDPEGEPTKPRGRKRRA